jgi:hypothetical protein
MPFIRAWHTLAQTGLLFGQAWARSLCAVRQASGTLVALGCVAGLAAGSGCERTGPGLEPPLANVERDTSGRPGSVGGASAGPAALGGRPSTDMGGFPLAGAPGSSGGSASEPVVPGQPAEGAGCAPDAGLDAGATALDAGGADAGVDDCDADEDAGL